MERICKIATMVLMLCITLSGFNSCSVVDDIDRYENLTSPIRIGIMDTILNMDVSGTEVYTIITLQGNYESWDTEFSEDWLNVEKGITLESGKEELTLTFTGLQNTYYSRSAIVKINLVDNGRTVSRTLRVIQASALDEPSVSATQTLIDLSSTAQSIDVDIETNQSSWEADTEVSWITLLKQGATLSISVETNPEENSREGLITIIAGNVPNTATVAIRIVQARADDESIITIDGIELVFVEGGDFNMGSQNTDSQAPNYGVATLGSHYNANQSPIHKVTLSDYYIGKFQITQDQWVKVMGTNPSRNTGANNGRFPVEYVDWNMAKEFVEKLSQQTGENFRLPTEAEWEYAARGGKESRGFLYSGGGLYDLVANFVATTDDRANSKTTAVGSFMPNELGLYDMSGNLYEWVGDYFGPYTASDKVNPTGPATGTNRIIRGGSWWHLPTTVYFRGNNVPTYTGSDPKAGLTGFRVVYTP